MSKLGPIALGVAWVLLALNIAVAVWVFSRPFPESSQLPNQTGGSFVH
jgi:hypothetical protein